MTATTRSADAFVGKSFVFYWILALSTLPIWLTPYLPMVDLPQHAAQIAALREYFSGNPEYVNLFELNWFTPYIVGYLALYALSSVFSVAFSTKLLVAAAIVGLPMATRRMLAFCGGDKNLAYLVIPASYGVAFSWGFLSFLVAAPLGILFFIVAVAHARNPTWIKAISIVLFSILLFFSHLLVLILASAISVVYVFVTNAGNLRRQVTSILPFVAPVPAAIFWLLIVKDTDSALRDAAADYPSLFYNVSGLLTKHAGLRGLGQIPGLVMTAATFAFPLLAGYRWSRSPERWLPFALVLIFYFAVPWSFLNSVYLNERFGIFLAAFWFLAWDRPERIRPRMMLVPAAALLAFLAVNTVVFNDFAKESRNFNELTASMEPGKRVLQMPVHRNGPGLGTPAYLHFGSWYQANTGGIVEFNFAFFYPMMLHYRDMADAGVGNRFSFWPTEFDWEEHNGDLYDYFIVRYPFEASLPLFKGDAEKITLVGNEGQWWLYARRSNETHNSDR